MFQVSIIGSGNVAHHLIKFFNHSEAFELKQVFARRYDAVSEMINPYQYINNIDQLHEVDALIICISDDFIEKISHDIQLKNTLILHTSGGQSIDVLSNHQHAGVLYPLQTFSKNKRVNLENIPLCIESKNQEDLDLLHAISSKISSQIYEVTSEQRKILHLSAVFVCNFANHLYQIGETLCEANQLPFELLVPLIEETANKVKYLSPKVAQTGPAIRGDIKTMQKHLDLLEQVKHKELYTLFSKMIKDNEL